LRNFWKYENSQQQSLWGGLAASIVRSIINRLDPVESKILLLKLNFKTLDIKGIFSSVKEIGFNYFWKKILRRISPYAIGIGVTVASIILIPVIGEFLPNPIMILSRLIGLTIILGLVAGLGLTILRTYRLMRSESIYTILDEYVKEPNNINLEHLRLILTAIPQEYKPIIIFIDDLDRCSSNTVMQVIEGINALFTERLPSIFLIAMDAEVVAAALEVAHKEILSKLPKYSTHSPLGWRFMDKFIQLPLMIPPLGENTVIKYVHSILQADSKDTKINNDNNENAQKDFLTSDSISNESLLTPAEIATAACEFSTNPRDIKRFVNVLRFYQFLRLEAIKSNYNSNQAIPSMDQIERWIILLLRWPSLIRWLYWSPGGKLIFELRLKVDQGHQNKSNENTSPVCLRLREVERIAKISKDHSDWEANIKAIIHTKDSNNLDMSQLTDENLKYFFELENEKDVQDRVSAGSGHGVY
jgi:hypothetical protein